MSNRRLIVNKKKRRKNYDPTRTLSIRQAFVKEVRKRFKILKGRLYKLIAVDDAFGLKERKPYTFNSNPYHDERGRFASGFGIPSVGDQEKAYDDGYLLHATKLSALAGIKKDGLGVAWFSSTKKDAGDQPGEVLLAYHRSHLPEKDKYGDPPISPHSGYYINDPSLGDAHISSSKLMIFHHGKLVPLDSVTVNVFSNPACGPTSLIEVPNVRQPNDFYCGAAATNCVAKLRGLNPGSVRRTAGELGTTVEKSTHPQAIIDYFQSRGITVEASQNLTIDDLRVYHTQGWPVIVPVQDYIERRDPRASFDYGHYLTVIGVGLGYVFCQDSSMENWENIEGGSVPREQARPDSNLDAPGRVMINYRDFLRAWHDKDMEGRKYIRFGIAVGPKEDQMVTRNKFCATGQGGGIDPSCGKDDSGSGSGGADSKMAHVLSLAKHLPAAMLNRVKGQVQKKYTKLSQRYGPTYAKAIIGAALVGLPIPLPGASFAAASLVIGVAELHRLASGHGTHNVADDFTMTKAEIQQAAKELVEEMRQEIGIVHNALLPLVTTTNADDFSFASSPEQLKKFQAWLRKQYASLLTGKTEEELWQIYAEQGFKRGAGRAFDDTNAGYYAAKVSDEGGVDFMAGGRDQFLRSAFGRPETVEKVQLLASRSFTDLVNVTEDMATKMSRILVTGLTTGSNPRDIADEMDDVLDIGLHRADVIARTEIIRAHAEGQLDAFDRLGVSEIGVEVEWSTAGDERVCPECEDMEGKIFSVDDAHGMIPLHPQCRCAFIPHIPEELTKNQRMLPLFNVPKAVAVVNASRTALDVADFVRLPDSVKGTNCGNCRFQEDGNCQHPKLTPLKVTPRDCCAYWDAEGTKRPRS